ncbi:hypothetical protein B0T21DRAFT_358717 [Apiosordaria backusii]|uniref:Uncharacterized protein n=1 Tax=Apiosordaria backusii TaxID=314023 RepID=A0AA40ESV4_9PEZI|nr:hypothetical protein B0T21DRAFT_358717 [Apiosordaria backusii]
MCLRVWRGSSRRWGFLGGLAVLLVSLVVVVGGGGWELAGVAGVADEGPGDETAADSAAAAAASSWRARFFAR